MTHPVLKPGSVAVVTGGAGGIGLAAATRFAALGMKVCIVDVEPDRLRQAASGGEDRAGGATASWRAWPTSAPAQTWSAWKPLSGSASAALTSL